MRISDWSSDVCSSDLVAAARACAVAAEAARDHADEAAVHRATHDVRQDRARRAHQRAGDDHRGVVKREPHRRRRPRSDEHTSELQSLMRLSYAVFCLKKKNKANNNKIFHT